MRSGFAYSFQLRLYDVETAAYAQVQLLYAQVVSVYAQLRTGYALLEAVDRILWKVARNRLEAARKSHPLALITPKLAHKRPPLSRNTKKQPQILQLLSKHHLIFCRPCFPGVPTRQTVQPLNARSSLQTLSTLCLLYVPASQSLPLFRSRYAGSEM